jgi:hypothetical protein
VAVGSLVLVSHRTPNPGIPLPSEVNAYRPKASDTSEPIYLHGALKTDPSFYRDDGKPCPWMAQWLLRCLSHSATKRYSLWTASMSDIPPNNS